jgi:hypothetical protein
MNCITGYVEGTGRDNSSIVEKMQAMEEYQQFF